MRACVFEPRVPHIETVSGIRVQVERNVPRSLIIFHLMTVTLVQMDLLVSLLRFVGAQGLITMMLSRKSLPPCHSWSQKSS